jgi:hypothetical protein
MVLIFASLRHRRRKSSLASNSNKKRKKDDDEEGGACIDTTRRVRKIASRFRNRYDRLLQCIQQIAPPGSPPLLIFTQTNGRDDALVVPSYALVDEII